MAHACLDKGHVVTSLNAQDCKQFHVDSWNRTGLQNVSKLLTYSEWYGLKKYLGITTLTQSHNNSYNASQLT